MEFFASLVIERDNFPLLEAAISIAQDEYPSLDIEETIDQIENLRIKLKARIPKNSDQLSKLRILNISSNILQPTGPAD